MHNKAEWVNTKMKCEAAGGVERQAEIIIEVPPGPPHCQPAAEILDF